MSCKRRDMAKSLGYEGCSGMASDVHQRVSKVLSPVVNKVNKKLKKMLESSDADQEKAVEFSSEAQQAIHDGVLAYISQMYIQEGRPIEDFVHDAAKMYNYILSEPARNLQRALREHFEVSLLDQAAKAHSPDN